VRVYGEGLLTSNLERSTRFCCRRAEVRWVVRDGAAVCTMYEGVAVVSAAARRVCRTEISGPSGGAIYLGRVWCNYIILVLIVARCHTLTVATTRLRILRVLFLSNSS